MELNYLNRNSDQWLKFVVGSSCDIYIYMYMYRTPLLTQSFELLSGSIGWGAGLQSSRLVQSKSSNPLKVL